MLNSGCVGLASSNRPSPSSIVILSSSATTTSLTSVSVAWQTNVPATSQVEYGTTTTYGSRTALDSSMVTNHSQQLTNLTTGTLYHYRLHSIDAHNVQAVNYDLTFTISRDTTPPSVSITSPTANATVSGTITVSAVATDNVGVAGVQFKVDNANTGGELTSPPYNYSLNTAGLSNGAHVLTATARDAAGNTATSAGVTVNVSNSTATPAVSITFPANGANVAATILFAASASSSQGITGVQFKLDNVNVGAEITSAPYNFLFNTGAVSNGSHILTAAARDNAGRSATSGGVTINVDNSVSTPSVSITSPANGATVSATISVVANAASSRGISGVQLKLDGNNVGAERTLAPYIFSLDTTAFPDGLHSLTATARDSAGTQTTSTPVNVTVQNSSSNPPVISGISASPSSTSALIFWTTDVPSDSQVDYGTTAGYGQSSTIDSTTTVDHGVIIAGLSTSTTYHFRVKSKGTNGLVATSGDNTLTTSSASGGIPPGLGWFQLPNTKLASVCNNSPSNPWHLIEGCSAVIADWSGGVADTLRNRLIVWGGGHGGYGGNEVYSLNLSDLTFTRLNSPFPASGSDFCNGPAYPNGTPNSRHTYSQIAYMANSDKMFAWSGPISCPIGVTYSDAWTLDMSNIQNPSAAWTRKDLTAVVRPAGASLPTNNNGEVSVYDPNTGDVFLYDLYSIFQYHLSSNTFTKLSDANLYSYVMNGEIDPDRKRMYLFGGGNVFKLDISGADASYTLRDISSSVTSCGLMKSESYPGLAYDPVQRKIVGWAGGNTAYVFDPDTNSCSSVTFPGGPGPQQGQGTNGRFRYFPAFGVFALVNDWQQNAYTLRLTSGSGSGATISNVTANGITTSGVTISWATDVPATTQVEYGTSTSYGQITSLVTSLTNSHSQAISGLTAGTLYHYRARSKTGAGIETMSGDAVFQTSTSGGGTPPVVSLILPIDGSTVSGTATVTASATGSLPIAGVQLLVDGVNLGAELTSAPYSLSWDTTAIPNGPHTLAARARDNSGSTATSIARGVTVFNSSIGSDFQARCTAPGVIRCIGFDSPSDLLMPDGFTSKLMPSDSLPAPILPTLDTSVKASGNSSLKFTIPAISWSNSGGSFATDFADDFSTQFDSGQEFYVQWRQRFSPEFVSTDYKGGGWKQVIIGEGDHSSYGDASSCTENEITLHNNFYREFPQVYHSCGTKDNQYESLAEPISATLDFRLQNNIRTPDPGCTRNNQTIPPCIGYKPDQWMTFQMHVKIGTWYVNNSGVYKHDSIVQLWVAEESKPSVLVLDFSPHSPSCAAIQSSIPADCQTGYDLTRRTTAPLQKYGKIWLLPYDTGKCGDPVSCGGRTFAQTYTWYDELIISRQRIPDPR